MKRRRFWRAVLVGLAGLSAAAAFAAPAGEVPNAAELALALKKLTVLGSALYVGAHPDDENTALLAYLSRGRLARAAYLSVTRGDGGQNLIGSEQGELVGLIRTQELLAARRIDGAEQFFTRALDFGYSKSPEETLGIWGHDRILADVVWVIRLFRPDIVITRFPTDGRGGHGQHTASSLLAEEAFAAAADPSRFPEQLRDVRPWRARRLVWNVFRFPNERGEIPPPPPGALPVDLGAYNTLLGRSYSEIAGESRSQHKSQGFGAPERRGSFLNHFERRLGDRAERDLFDGVDLSWGRVPGGLEVGKILEEAAQSFDARDPSRSIPLLARAHAELGKLPADDPWVVVKRRDLEAAIRGCAGLWLEAIASAESAVPGAEVRIAASALNRSDAAIRLGSIEASTGERAPVADGTLKNNEPLRRELIVKLPAEAPYTHPFWLELPPDKGAFAVADPARVADPEGPPGLAVRFRLEVWGARIAYEVPVLYRWTDPVRGDLYRPFAVVPKVTIRFDEPVYVFPEMRERRVHLTLRAGAANLSGSVRLKAPTGFQVRPAEIPFALSAREEEAAAEFVVRPPSGTSSGHLTAEALLPEGSFSRGRVVIDYPHIPMQVLHPPAKALAVRVEVKRRKQRIGYLAGSGDEIPNALRQLGYSVEVLSEEDLERGGLARYQTIVTGVRAYNTRKRLRQWNPRLLDYVRAGGTLVVQYNTLQELATEQIGPYPFKISRDRVTVEEAPVSLVVPTHALLTSPNRITAEDFSGWVQERGLYFARDWDARYQTPLACGDPGEPERAGGLLYARSGRGVFIYTGYAFFRQLPAGVPGAYRLFANLVSAGGGGGR